MKKSFLAFTILVQSYVAICQCNPDIHSGIIARWDFNGNAFDSSGNGHHGILGNPVLTTDRCGTPNSAYTFYGSTQYINIADAQDLRLSNTDFTISAWIVKWDTTENPNFSIISKRVFSGQQGYHFFVEKNSLKPGFAVSGNSDPTCFADSAIAKEVWQHVAMTYTLADSTVRFYLDGTLNGKRGSIPSPNPNSNSVLRIGNDTWFNGAYGFNGKIDDIRIYNRALDSCSIVSLITDALDCSLTPVQQAVVRKGANMYPNPTKGLLKIDDEDFEKIFIYNGLGAIVGEFNQTENLNLSGMANGIYLISILGRSGEILNSARIIKE